MILDKKPIVCVTVQRGTADPIIREKEFVKGSMSRLRSRMQRKYDQRAVTA